MTATKVVDGKNVPDYEAGFRAFINTMLGKILMIVIDQIIHLLFLLPVAWMALQHCHVEKLMALLKAGGLI